MNMKRRTAEDLEYVRSWFVNHKATMKDGWLIWSAPNTSVYRCDFHVYRNNLIVVGDIGDAVFTWSQVVTFDWIAGLEFDYFMGKCQASETGRKLYDWNGEYIMEILAEHLTNEETGDKSKLNEALGLGARDAANYEQEWHQWVSANSDILGDDYGEWIMGGQVHALRGRGMFEGLKLAVAQLEAAKC
jgi:hypothetical protein